MYISADRIHFRSAARAGHPYFLVIVGCAYGAKELISAGRRGPPAGGLSAGAEDGGGAAATSLTERTHLATEHTRGNVITITAPLCQKAQLIT